MQLALMVDELLRLVVLTAVIAGVSTVIVAGIMGLSAFALWGLYAWVNRR